MLNDSIQPAHITYNSRLLSGRRPVMIVVGFTIGMILTIALHSDIATIAAVQTGLALALIRIYSPDNLVWSEPMQLRIESDGVRVIRPSGRSQSADWTMFDEIRLHTLRPPRLAGQHGTWKLTLMNARKPAISSFINMDADQVLFMFPLELTIDATEREAMELQRTLELMVAG